eukprot:SAG11_NODE_2544_length_3236_cov_5.076187_1_plen_179_part_00
MAAVILSCERFTPLMGLRGLVDGCAMRRRAGDDCENDGDCVEHASCQYPVGNIEGDGIFSDGMCACNDGWTASSDGVDCQTAHNPCDYGPAGLCSGHGTCDEELQLCSCAPGYSGQHCERSLAVGDGADGFNSTDIVMGDDLVTPEVIVTHANVLDGMTTYRLQVHPRRSARQGTRAG